MLDKKSAVNSRDSSIILGFQKTCDALVSVREYLVTKSIMILLLLLSCFTVSLSAQFSMPRTIYFRLVEPDGRSLPRDTTGISFTATLRDNVKYHTTFNFGYLYGGNDLFSRIQLGNFDLDWTAGDTLTYQAFRRSPLSKTREIYIVIPEGAETVWWGRPPDKKRQDYPGEPVPLYPFILSFASLPGPDIPVIKNGEATQYKTGDFFHPSNVNDATGIFSLAPPPSGYRWEPAKYLVTPRDFEFSESAYADADGVAQPGWARTLEFRLVPEE